MQDLMKAIKYNIAVIAMIFVFQHLYMFIFNDGDKAGQWALFTAVGVLAIYVYVTWKIEDGSWFTFFFAKKIKIDGHTLYYNKRFNKVWNTGAGNSFTFHGKSYVMVGDRFFKLSEDAKRFVLYHELTHADFIESTTDNERMTYMDLGEVHPIELACDDGAVRAIGVDKTLSGLNELANTLVLEGHGEDSYAVAEIRLRTKLITQKYSLV